MDNQGEKDLGKEVLRRYSGMVNERTEWNTMWDDVASFIFTRHEKFALQVANFNNNIGGEKRNQKVYDNTPGQALKQCVAIVDSILTPSGSRWHTLTTRDERLSRNAQVRRYFDDLTDVLFTKRYVGSSNFAGQIREFYRSLFAFGNACMYVDEDFANGGVRYRTIPLSRVYIAENNSWQVDTTYYAAQMTARQIAQEYGEEKLPSSIAQALKDNSSRPYDVIIACTPATDSEDLEKGWRHVSTHVARDGDTVLRRTGYRYNPFLFARLETNPGELYASGPGVELLETIKTLNLIMRSQIITAQKLSEPPTLVHSDGIANRYDLRPNAISYGAISAEGRPLVQPYNVGAQPQLAELLMNQARKAINDAFLVNLFNVLVETPQMTATEVLKREQERAWLISPIGGRLREGFFQQLIANELRILDGFGLLPEMPDVLTQGKAPGEYEIQFVSPYSAMQNSTTLLSINKLFQSAAAFAQMDPRVVDALDLDAALREVALVENVPQRILRDTEAVSLLREQREQQKQLEQTLSNAPGAASAIKDIAQAQQISQGF